MTKNLPNFIILAISTLATVSVFGLGYGSDNHHTYLIHGLTLIDPDFLSGDWFAHRTRHYHDQFSVILIAINFLGLPISTGTVAIEVIVRILSFHAIYKITTTLTDRNLLFSYLSVLFLILLEGTQSVANTYIFSPTLQPSSFGSVFLLYSFLFFLQKRFLPSGLCAALGGGMHTNFLILAFVVFAISHLFLGTKGLWERLFSQFLCMAVVLSIKVPFLLEIMSYDSGQTADYIFQFIRSPHHYVPNSFLFDFILFFGWTLLGISGIQARPSTKQNKQFLALYFSILGLLVISTFLTTIVFIPAVSKLFFWRLAPFFVLLSQIAFIASLAGNASRHRNTGGSQSKPKIFLWLLGILLICTWYLRTYSLFSINILALTFSLAVLSFLFFGRRIPWPSHQGLYNSKFSRCILLGGFAFFLIFQLTTVFFDRSTLINGSPGEQETTLYRWVKTTSASSRFLIPPDLISFRLHGERAVVVDWKSTPIDPEGLIQWYERIKDIAGTQEVYSLADAKHGYSEMDLARLRLLTKKYDLTHAVLYPKESRVIDTLPIVFKNRKFLVVAVKHL